MCDRSDQPVGLCHGHRGQDLAVFRFAAWPFGGFRIILLSQLHGIVDDFLPVLTDQLDVHLVDLCIEIRGGCLCSQRNHTLADDLAGVDAFVKLEQSHAGLVEALEDGPGDRGAATTNRQQGRMHADAAIGWGLKQFFAGNLGPADDEQPVDLKVLQGLDHYGIIDIVDLEQWGLMRRGNPVKVDPARLVLGLLILEGDQQIDMTADPVDFLDTAETELDTGGKGDFFQHSSILFN